MADHRDELILMRMAGRWKQIREHFGYESGEEFGRSLGLTGPAYRKYERGEAFLPRPHVVDELQKRGVSLDYLIAGIGSMITNSNGNVVAPSNIDTQSVTVISKKEYRQRVLGPCPREKELKLSEPYVAVASDEERKLYIAVHESADVIDVRPTAASFYKGLESAREIAAKRGIRLVVIEDDIDPDT